MSLEAKLQHFHHYVSNQNLPLEAISVGDEHRILWEMHYAQMRRATSTPTQRASPSPLSDSRYPMASCIWMIIWQMPFRTSCQNIRIHALRKFS